VSADRESLQLALGSPQEPDAEEALSLLLAIMLDEAKTLGDDTPSIAHACRMEALKNFVEQHMTVSWADTAPTGGAT
jgi:hypothetical protein